MKFKLFFVQVALYQDFFNILLLKCYKTPTMFKIKLEFSLSITEDLYHNRN